MGKINAVVHGWSPRYAAITLTQGTLELLTRDELRAYLTQAVLQIKLRHARLYYCLRDLALDCGKPHVAATTVLATGGVGLPWFLVSLGAQHWLRSKIASADREAASHLIDPSALASAIDKENEHAGFPYKLGSSPALTIFNNWPTAAERTEIINKVVRQRNAQ